MTGMNPNCCCFLLEGTETLGPFGVGTRKFCEKFFVGLLVDAVVAVVAVAVAAVGMAGVNIWLRGLNGLLGVAGLAATVVDGIAGTAGIMNFDDALFANV